MTERPSFAWVAGGTCAYGDTARPVPVRGLWWSTTCVTWRQARRTVPAGVAADEPVTLVGLHEAAGIAAGLGGRLPTSVEWEWMAGGRERRRYPWGEQDWEPSRGNLAGSGHGRALPVGAAPRGATPQGLLDVAGNVWEWTSSPVLGDGAIVRGGSYNSRPLYARCRFLNAAPVWVASPGIGLRMIREP